MDDPQPATTERTSPEQIAAAFAPMLATANDMFTKWMADRERERVAIEAHNKLQSALWEKAVTLEGWLIGGMVSLAFIFAAGLAWAGQVATAEKIAFALFGFIGGRGFLHVRALMERAASSR